MNWYVLILFVLLPALGTVLGIRNWLLFRYGIRVTGRIVGHERLEPMSGSETVHLPIVDFSANGRIMRVTMSGESPHAGSGANDLGATVKLIHPHGRPKRVRYDERMLYWLVPAMCFAPALTLALGIGCALAWHRWFE